MDKENNIVDKENKLKNVRLGDLLVKSNVLSEEHLQAALEKQKKGRDRLGEILVKNGWLTESQLIEALSNQLHLPLISTARYRPMPDAVRLIPKHVAERLQVLPLSITDDGHLMVATADPLDLLAADELRILSETEIDFNLCAASHIRRDLDRIYSIQESLDDAEIEVMHGVKDDPPPLGDNAIQDDSSVDDAPVIKIVNTILEQGIREGSSDIHIEPFEKNTRVRFRVDGQLYSALDFSRGLHPAVTSRIKIMSGIDISEKRKPQDGRILIKVLDRRVDLRVSTLPSVYGEKTVIRVLDQSAAMVGLEKLGFESQDRDLIDDVLRSPYGIILVTGPTGSGKSTTLYSFLDQLNKPEVNIITVEDPVEFSISGINQVQVDERSGRTFSSVLRAILRQDPDIIMLGEIRDGETANLAIRAALTGHLVLSTLHTNDATSAPIRLSDMGIQPFLVASSVRAVIAQRLVRRLCSACKMEFVMNPNLCRDLGLPEGSKAFRPVGCDACRGMGYSGRTSLFEILPMSDPIRERILSQESSAEIRNKAIELGMRTLRQAGLAKVLNGVTSVEEMMNVTL
ncbi:MAG: type II secretion system protein GspE [Dethiosulfovibrio peptidovorans]|nr:MAG: type II secretion system protein GspE [Dethiosulfovibrio peptidovorans]